MSWTKNTKKMKNILIILTWVVCWGALSAQTGFEFYSSDSLNNLSVSGVVELGNERFVLAGIKSTISSGKRDIVLYLLSEEGDLLQSELYQYPNYSLINTGVFVESDTSFLLTGLANGINGSKLWVGHFSNDLGFISEEVYDYDLPKIELMNVRRESDTTLIFTGWLGGSQPYAAKINLLNKTLHIVKYVGYADYLFDIFPRKDSLGYLMLGDDKMYLTDSAFNITRVIDKPMGYLNGSLADGFKDTTYVFTSKIHYGLLEPDSTAFLVCETGMSDWSVLKSQLLADTISLVNNMKLRPYAASKKSLAQNTKDIFVGGINSAKFFPIDRPSKFVLGKYDDELDELWQKEYGDSQMFYFMVGLLTTSDGGCAMFGYRVQYTNSDRQEAYILKVNEGGVVTGETIIPIQNLFFVYPNPAKNSIQFDLPNTYSNSYLQLIDISGRIVLVQKIKDYEPINISFLPKGIYGYQILDTTGALLGVGKLVKE